MITQEIFDILAKYLKKDMREDEDVGTTLEARISRLEAEQDDMLGVFIDIHQLLKGQTEPPMDRATPTNLLKDMKTAS
jgi:hypothetical protein